MLCNTDINECIDGNGGCGHTCVNTPGSYHCKCNSGYVLQTDKHNCTGKFVCEFIMYVAI